jgi:c-di-GMP-binding flagellar brake protein YcgR
VQTTDVSLNGMGMLMRRDVVVALAQGGSVLTPGDRFDVVLSPDVSQADGLIGPTVPGRVRHVRRLSQHEYQVGVLFEEVDTAQQAALQAMVDLAQADRTR